MFTFYLRYICHLLLSFSKKASQIKKKKKKKLTLPPKCPLLNLSKIIYFSVWEFLTICSMCNDVWGYFGLLSQIQFLFFILWYTRQELWLHTMLLLNKKTGMDRILSHWACTGLTSSSLADLSWIWIHVRNIGVPHRAGLSWSMFSRWNMHEWLCHEVECAVCSAWE